MFRVTSSDEDPQWNDDIAWVSNLSTPATGAGDISHESDDRAAIASYLNDLTASDAFGATSVLRSLDPTSSLLALLADTRAVAGREPRTGRLPTGVRGSSWLAAVGYCIALDQIGGVFTTDPASGRVQPFRRALDAFTDLGADEIEALYAMRCALVHDYSAVNLDQHATRRKLDHAFALNADPAAPLIRLPRTRYDRERPHDIRPDNQTWVNIRAFGDLVERVVVELRDRHERGELQLHVDRDDLARRFGLSFTTPETDTSD